jgi:hypothetical protein
MEPTAANDICDFSAIEGRVNAVLNDPLAAAAAGGALGYVGLDIPPDLLLAGNAVPCHLPLRLPRDTARTGLWLESSFPLWTHSVLESWWNGEFDCFDHVIFSRGDDASHRLYYYICELQRQGRIGGPRPLVFDVARIARESSRRHTASAIGELMRELGIEETALRQGARLANDWRRLFAFVHAERRGPGSFYERVVRASLYADPRVLLQGWNPQLLDPSGAGVVLAGSSPPDDRIHLAIEQTGWTVLEELYDRGLGRLGAQVDVTAADLPRSIAERWLEHQFSSRDSSDPAVELIATVRRTRAVAAILWCSREDEALAWRVAGQRAALQRAGIPALVLVARSWRFDDGAAEEIHSFLGGLPLESA